MTTKTTKLSIFLILGIILIAGCIESGEISIDGFEIDETRNYDFTSKNDIGKMDVSGTITWTGDHYSVCFTTESVIADLFVTTNMKGPIDNVKLKVYADGAFQGEDYMNLEDTQLLEEMLMKAK